MNSIKQQTIAAFLTICCFVIMPLEADAKKKEAKIKANDRLVVSSVPQSRAKKQSAVQNVPVANDDKNIMTIDDKNSAPTNKTATVTQIGANKSVLPSATMSKKTPSLPMDYKEISIFGEAVATKTQAVELLKQCNPELKLTCDAETIVDFYWQEAGREGVRQDIALAQALVETGFFRFGGDVKPEQNNFCGLGTTGGGVKGAHFATPQLGVRAHIQHLLAYTTQKHPSTKIIDPRYDLAHAIRMERGLCDTWYKLNGTWAMSPNYSEKIMGVWQRMLDIEIVEEVNQKTQEKNIKKDTEKNDDKMKKEAKTTAGSHKMRDRVNELLKKNK